MIVVGNVVASDEVAEREFVCNLTKCKGACCVEGDLGAPLEQEEVEIIDRILDKVRPYMSPAGREAVDKQGTHILDWEGDLSTTTINGRECAFALYDKQGILKCSFEQAFREGKTDWIKPISCHLYPIRLTAYDHYTAMNYNHWHICSDACALGRELQVPVYKFLREPLTRKFGQEWYAQFERACGLKGK